MWWERLPWAGRWSVWVWSYVVWGIGWLLIGFLVTELTGYWRLTPWRTLSETVWHASTTYWFVGPLVFATLIFMSVHFLYRRPIWQSIAFGLIIAGLAHLIDKHL